MYEVQNRMQQSYASLPKCGVYASNSELFQDLSPWHAKKEAKRQSEFSAFRRTCRQGKQRKEILQNPQKESCWYRMVQARWGKVSNIFWWPKSIFHYNYDKIKGTNHICIGLRNSLGMHARGLGLCICFLTIFRVLHKINLTKCPFFFPFCEMEKNPTLEKQLVWLMLYFYLFIQQCPWNAFGALFTQKMWSSNVFGAFFSQECTWCGTWFCYVFLSHVPCPGDYCIHLIRCSSPWPSKCGWVTGLNLKPGSPVNGQGEVGGSGSAQVLPKISPEHIYIYIY